MNYINRNNCIDSWRLIAVFMVIVGHLFQVRNNHSPVDAFLGVLIFFFISGFVVGNSSLNELRDTGDFSIIGFYVRRAFRIIPALMIYLIACYVLGALGVINFGLNNLFGAAIYLCNTTLVECGWYAGHTWSLAFEEQFYLLFPLIFVWIEIKRRPNFLILSIVFFVLSLSFWFSISWIGKTGFLLIYGLFIIGYFFAKYEILWTSISKANIIFMVGIFITFFPVYLIDNLLINKYYKFFYLISIPLMIGASLSSSFVFGGLFRIPLFSYIGKISYSIYLWQQLFTDYFKDLSILLNIVIIILMIFGCFLIFEKIEKPLIEKGRVLSRMLKIKNKNK